MAQQLAALARLGPEGRIRIALELSEAVRSIQLQGILARNPEWQMSDVRHLVQSQFGIDLTSR
jgi:hypothetical protein